MNSSPVPHPPRRRAARALGLAAIGAAALFLLASCSKTSDTTATGSSAAPSTAAVTTAPPATSGATTGSTAGGASTSATTIKLAKVGSNMAIVDEKGLTLYLFTKDTGTTSTCVDTCAKLWPPSPVTGKPTVGAGLDASKVATTSRSDGSMQVTYNGHPLYTYAMDKAPGDANGEGVGGIWFTVDAQGNQIGK